MNNQEAIEIIKIAVAEVEWNYPMEYAAAFDMAIGALEKMETVEPTPGGRDDIEGIYWHTCPECNADIAKWDRYCRGCGRKVKWNDQGDG